jgi:hypothetical protein
MCRRQRVAIAALSFAKCVQSRAARRLKSSRLKQGAPMTTSLGCFAFVLASGVSLSAYAAGPAATATVQDGLVDLSWSDGGKEKTRVALTLPTEHTCSSAELERDRKITKVVVCRVTPDVGGDPNMPLLEVGVERTDTSTPQVRQLHFKATARLRRGASIVIGRFEPTDWINELVATLR